MLTDFSAQEKLHYVFVITGANRTIICALKNTIYVELGASEQQNILHGDFTFMNEYDYGQMEWLINISSLF